MTNWITLEVCNLKSSVVMLKIPFTTRGHVNCTTFGKLITDRWSIHFPTDLFSKYTHKLIVGFSAIRKRKSSNFTVLYFAGFPLESTMNDSKVRKASHELMSF